MLCLQEADRKHFSFFPIVIFCLFCMTVIYFFCVEKFLTTRTVISSFFYIVLLFDFFNKQVFLKQMFLRFHFKALDRTV